MVLAKSRRIHPVSRTCSAFVLIVALAWSEYEQCLGSELRNELKIVVIICYCTVLLQIDMVLLQTNFKNVYSGLT